MKKFNNVMQMIFVIISTVGFIGVCCEPIDGSSGIKIIMISCGLFILGFVGCVFFSDPGKYIRYIAGILCIVITAIYEFCHDCVDLLKLLYEFKKKCGSYRKMFKQFKINYHKYRNIEDDRSVIHRV